MTSDPQEQTLTLKSIQRVDIASTTSSAIQVKGTNTSISGDGSKIVFLTAPIGYEGFLKTVTVFDRSTNNLKEVNAITNQYINPSISKNGRYIVSDSYSDPYSLEEKGHIYVHDLLNDITYCVLHDSEDQHIVSGKVTRPSISEDGRFIVYIMDYSKIYVHDRDVDGDNVYDELGEVSSTLLNISIAGETPQNVKISSNGRYVFFTAEDVTETSKLYVYDRVNDTTTFIANAERFDMSPDGQLIIYSYPYTEVVGETENNVNHVFLVDLDPDKNGSFVEAPTIQRITYSFDGQHPVDGHSYASSISADGRLIAYNSWAKNLVEGMEYSILNIYLYDRDAQQTMLLTDGTISYANGCSYAPSISSDGKTVSFISEASNLVEGDTNGTAADVFIVELEYGTSS